MKVFYAVLAAVLLVLVAITLSFNGESNVIYGIADSCEIEVNVEDAVEIRQIYVEQGQAVKFGDTLVELDRSDLTMEISNYERQIDELRSEKESRIQELKSMIHELESEYELNRQLTSELKSIQKDKSAAGNKAIKNPMASHIAELKKELSYELSQDNPVEAQIKKVREELSVLSQRKSNLVICSSIDGVVGSVNFKRGAKVSPFLPILTVHTRSPRLIRGYIHENVYAAFDVGKKVRVRSLADRHNVISGEVTGIGVRIVEYPLRLRKRQDIQIWGREIIVQIPPDNNFLLGEKVGISLDEPRLVVFKK